MPKATFKMPMDGTPWSVTLGPTPTTTPEPNWTKVHLKVSQWLALRPEAIGGVIDDEPFVRLIPENEARAKELGERLNKKIRQAVEEWIAEEGISEDHIHWRNSPGEKDEGSYGHLGS